MKIEDIVDDIKIERLEWGVQVPYQGTNIINYFFSTTALKNNEGAKTEKWMLYDGRSTGELFVLNRKWMQEIIKVDGSKLCQYFIREPQDQTGKPNKIGCEISLEQAKILLTNDAFDLTSLMHRQILEVILLTQYENVAAKVETELLRFKSAKAQEKGYRTYKLLPLIEDYDHRPTPEEFIGIDFAILRRLKKVDSFIFSTGSRKGIYFLRVERLRRKDALRQGIIKSPLQKPVKK